MDIARSNVNTKDKIVLVTGSVCFVGKAFFVFPFVEHSAFWVGGGYHRFLLLWRFFVIATQAKDLFGALIASGAMAHMMIQVILNIAVVTNTIPNTGITLPFISYGGTSVMFLLFEMGLVLNVSCLVK